MSDDTVAGCFFILKILELGLTTERGLGKTSGVVLPYPNDAAEQQEGVRASELRLNLNKK